MAEVVIQTIFKLKRGNSTDWTAQNPLLEAGEPGFELDTGKLKIGNGVTRWNDLKYIGGENVSIDTDGSSIIVNKVGRISLSGFAEAQAGYSLRKTADGTLEWYNPITKKDLDDFYTKSEVNAQIDEVIAEKLADAGLTLVKVNSISDIDLTVTDAKKHIYLVPRNSETDNIYDEYIIVDDKLERIGSTIVTLDGYVKKEEFIPITTKVNSIPNSVLADLKEIKTVEDGIIITLNKFKLNNNIYEQDTNEEIKIPLASATSAGIISKEDKLKLDKIDPDAITTVTGAIINGEEAALVNNKIVIPIAGESAGVIKSSEEISEVFVKNNGTAEVKKLGIDRLENVEGVELVLCAGGAESV